MLILYAKCRVFYPAQYFPIILSRISYYSMNLALHSLSQEGFHAVKLAVDTYIHSTKILIYLFFLASIPILKYNQHFWCVLLFIRYYFYYRSNMTLFHYTVNELL